MVLATLEDGWRYLESFLDKQLQRSKGEYRLTRMKTLAALLGNPQQDLAIFHIAGSKGKGSTATLLARALSHNGSVTGLFTSPHLRSYRERIRVFNYHLDDQVILAELRQIQQLLDQSPPCIPEQPTFFELITLLALLVFRRCGCQFVVLEVGLGGRLDATNIVTPLASIITTIELEHCAILGPDLESIAAEKGGIIKAGVPVFSAPQARPVRQVLAKIAQQQASPLLFLDQLLARARSQVLWREHCGLKIPTEQEFELVWCDGSMQQGRLTLLGEVQLSNAALVLALLTRFFPQIDPAIWMQGIAQAYLDARCQFLPFGQAVLCLDGAHTPQSINATLANFLPPSQGLKRHLLFATLPDKDCQAMAAQLAPHFSQVVVSQLGSSFKQVDLQQVAHAFAQQGCTVELAAYPAQALQLVGGAQYVLVCGSFYLAGEVLSLLEQAHSRV